MGSEIDDYFETIDSWRDEAAALRSVLQATPLVEDWKWNQPCYTHEGKNVAMIAPFAKYCSLSFFAGVLLADPDGLLITPGKDSQSARQLRFTSVDAIEARKEAIVAFVAEAIRHVDEGTKVDFSAKDELELPVELIDRFADVDGLEAAFQALTPGRQRGFVLHISGAKQSTTRAKRVESHLDRILAGKGIHDCICGKSARLPRCDGSHSQTS